MAKSALLLSLQSSLAAAVAAGHNISYNLELFQLLCDKNLAVGNLYIISDSLPPTQYYIIVILSITDGC